MVSDLSENLAKGVYFLSPEGLLTHNSGCLMEALLDLGVPVFSNATKLTSRQVSMPLKELDLAQFKAEPSGKYSTYIVDITHTNTYVSLEGIDRRQVAYLNTSDSSVFCRIPNDFLLCSTHESRFADKGGNRHPLAFGPSNWLITQTENRKDYASRSKRVLRNFRPTLSQGVRAMLDLSLVPRLKAELSVDSTIYAPKDYLAALLDSSACLAYGGDFYSPIMQSEWFAKHQKGVHELHTFERLDHDALILRWDSWRFWEAMVSGCVAIHLNFEKYGFNLPILPKPWVHYVPIDLDDIEGSVEEFMDRQSEWPTISETGRAWAIEHYAPKSVALRVLNALSETET